MKKRGHIVGLCLIVLGVICAGIGGYRHLSERNAGKIYEELKEQAQNTSASKEEQTAVDAQKETKTQEEIVIQEEIKTQAEMEEIPIDFDTLIAQYPDIYAWIQIPGTVIDYPIVQREGDNAYYLNHTIDGKKKTEGAIFTEDYNGKDFTDPNTLIYGHNMKNDSMFGELHNYKDRKFLEENPEIIIYLPDQVLHYQIFAAYVYDNRHILLNFDFEDPDVYDAYLKSIFQRKGMSSNIDTSVEVTTEDQIITLSTCNGNDTQRYLVQAVLISK